jgi:hypothetical protein
LEAIIVEYLNQIPTLADLALQYGTITTEQHQHLQKVYALKKKEGPDIAFGPLILSLNFATQYQVGLLKLIEDYLIIKKQGEAFGRIAVEKGFATKKDIEKALAYQKKEFQRAKLRKLIGDILVESQVITVKQKNAILKEQVFLDAELKKIQTEAQPLEREQLDSHAAHKDPTLTEYEKKFLRIKVLDKEFSACAIEKGFATDRQVRIAQKAQEKAFEKENRIRILADFMVHLDFMTEDQKTLVLKEQQRLEALARPDKDPDITIEISKDKMEAVVKITKGIENLYAQDIRSELQNRGIKFGVYPDPILQCHLDMKNTEFVAARQDFSVELVKGRKASYSFDVDKVDTQEKKMGATLAEQYRGKEIFIKKDVFGNNLEQSQGYDFTFRCAAGTRLSSDQTKAFAGKTGFPSLSIERKLYIHPAIFVLEDADLKYGPLETYANLNISGILTGAYPVTAGDLNAREIRGARIEAIGSVRTEIGITDSFISAQGDVYAKYLHNSRIETFGNVYIEKEMIDSNVFSSGKIDSKQCRVVSSTLFAKKGIELAGAGNGRTRACILGAGTEHHLLTKVKQLHLEIQNIRRPLDELNEKKDEQHRAADKIFQKMIELKIFHDRAKNKKLSLSNEFQQKKELADAKALKNIVTLVQTFEKRMEEALDSLKKLNETKKKYDRASALLEQKIKKVEPEIGKKISELQIDVLAFFEWARKHENHPFIKIKDQAFSGTVFKGVYSQMSIEKELNHFSLVEKQNSTGNFNLVLGPY